LGLKIYLPNYTYNVIPKVNLLI